MSKNVVDFVDMKDRMPGRKAIVTASIPAAPISEQLAELIGRLKQELATFCSHMKGAIDEDALVGDEKNELMFCQLRVLHDVLSALGKLTTILPRTMQPHNQGRQPDDDPRSLEAPPLISFPK